VQQSLEHLILHHGDTEGFITLAQKDENGRFRSWHYKHGELEEAISEWHGNDVYFSQNSFFTTRRKIEYLKQLKALYVDIDCYKVPTIPSPEWVLGHLEVEVFGKILPTPNYITFSGRGLVLVWLIEPVSAKELPLWKTLERHFYEQLKYLGSDPASTDPARIFRLAGSTSSKNGNTVRMDVRHHYRYNLDDLAFDYLPELPEKKQPLEKLTNKGNTIKPTSTKSKPKNSGQIKRFFNLHNLHYHRLLDLVKLVELRKGNIEIGIREITCFLYRYWTCCYKSDSKEALEDTLSFNDTFLLPLDDEEVIQATKSAEKAWRNLHDEEAILRAREKGFKANGYNYTNNKIIELLKITADEQKELSTIISREEKYRRNNAKRANKRRENGILTIREYQQQRKASASDKAQSLRDLLIMYPKASNYQLAELLGVTEGYIRKLKKHLN